MKLSEEQLKELSEAIATQIIDQVRDRFVREVGKTVLNWIFRLSTLGVLLAVVWSVVSNAIN